MGHGLQITRRDIEHAHSMARRAAAATEKAKAQGEHITGTLVTALETGASALGFGVLLGRFGEIKAGPVPADLGAGIVLHGLGFLGIAGKYQEHIHAFANGALASYLVRLGAGLGTTMGLKAAQAPAAAPAQVSGSRSQLFTGVGRPLSPMQLMNLAQRRAA